MFKLFSVTSDWDVEMMHIFKERVSTHLSILHYVLYQTSVSPDT